MNFVLANTDDSRINRAIRVRFTDFRFEARRLIGQETNDTTQHLSHSPSRKPSAKTEPIQNTSKLSSLSKSTAELQHVVVNGIGGRSQTHSC